MEINSLIKKITPLYNSYKLTRKQISGTQALEIMWEIGDLLKEFIVKNKVAPHALYRKIYGKSEGKTNIVQKSYITREFLNRCNRIRRIFHEKNQIVSEFPVLGNFINFREAMPFFDNGKYGLKGEERKRLVFLLNSKLSPRAILMQIRELQKEKIGIKNPRTQRLKELEQDRSIFLSLYDFIKQLIKTKSYQEIELNLKEKNVEPGYILNLVKNTNALSQDGLKFYSFEIPQNIPSNLAKFGYTLQKLILKTDPKERRRFRRLIPPRQIVKLAEMLYVLISQEAYLNFKKSSINKE